METFASGALKIDPHFFSTLAATAVEIMKSDKAISSTSESFPIVDDLIDYTLEKAKEKMMAYRVDRLFLLARGQKENEYSLFLYSQGTISEFPIEYVDQEFMVRSNEGPVSSVKLNLIVSFVKGMIPFSFLYDLEKENLFLPSLSDKETKEARLDEMQKISQKIPEHSVKPQTFFLYSQNGQLNLLYSQRKNGEWTSIRYPLDEKDFENFQLVFNKTGNLRSLFETKFSAHSEESISVKPTLTWFNKYLFEDAVPLPLFVQKCVSFKSSMNEKP